MKSYFRVVSMLFIVLNIFCYLSDAYTATLEDNMSNNDWGPIHEITIVSSNGVEKAFVRRYPTDSITIRDDGDRQVVFVPTKRYIWIGLPTDHLVIIGDKVAGFYPMYGGVLRMIISDNKSTVSDIINQKSELEQLRHQNSAIWGQPGICKDIPLWKFVGQDILSLVNDARGPLPVTIKGVSLKDNNVILNMKSVNGKLIVLFLDKNLDTVSITVDGKQIYPK